MMITLISLLNYQNGSIKILGKEMKPDEYELKKQIGVVFQEVAVFEELNVYDNIDYFCGLYIENKTTRKKYIEDALLADERIEQITDFKTELEKNKLKIGFTAKTIYGDINFEGEVKG